MNTFFKLVFGLFPLYLFSMDQETPNTNSLKGTTLRWENEKSINFSVLEYDKDNHLYFVKVFFAKHSPEPNKYSYTVTLKPIFKEKEPKKYPQFTGENAEEILDFVLKDIKNPKKHYN